MSLLNNDSNGGWGQAPPSNSTKWDSDSVAASSNSANSNAGANTWLMPNDQNNTNVAQVVGGAAQPVQSEEAPPAAVSCLSSAIVGVNNGSMNDWQAANDQGCSSGTVSPTQQQQVSPEQPTGSVSNELASDSSASAPGEFERITLAHLLKDEHLDLFSGGWGSSPIDHQKPWRIPPNQASTPAQPTLMIASSNKAYPQMDGMRSMNCANSGNWRNMPAVPTQMNSQSTGTDLWESTILKAVRPSNSPDTDQPAIMPSPSAQWTPAAGNNIGGTWGEDEENNPNMWTGVPSGPGSVNSSQWMMDDMKQDSKWNKAPSTSSWGEHDDKHEKGHGQWDRASTNGSSNMMNGRNNNDGNFGTWNPPGGNGRKENGWEEMMPDAHLNSAVDDGTNVWGAHKQRGASASNNLRWNKDEQMDARSMKAPIGNSLCSAGPMNNGSFNGPPCSPGRGKPNAQKGWNDMGPSGGGGWNAQANNGGNMWNDSMQGNMSAHWNGAGNAMKNGKSGWNEQGGQMVDTSDWSNSKRRPISRDLILASNQYRLLVDMGFKKEDVEHALRTCNMNLDEALEELRAMVLRESGIEIDRRKVSAFNSNPSSLPLNASISNNANTSLMNQMPAQQMRGGPKPSPATTAGAHMGGMSNSMPSEKQLSHLVQQIQLAVQSGHLNAQILNQPLGVATIQLIYQLLQQIKSLQQFQMQMRNGPKSSSSIAQVHVQITQVRQRILNLQNQIKVQQAVFMSQQLANSHSSQHPQQQPQQQQQQPQQLAQPNQLLVNPLSTMPLNSQVMDFKNIVTPDGMGPQMEQISRLNQWKLNSFDKEMTMPSGGSNNFSRAPGAFKPSVQGTNSPMQDMQNAWNTFGLEENTPTASATSWSPTSGTGNSLSSLLDNSPADSLAGGFANAQTNSFGGMQDMVPEFEPGKPWKGSVKTLDDESPLGRPALYQNWAKAEQQPIGQNAGQGFQSTWAFGSAANSLKSPDWNSGLGTSCGGVSASGSPVHSPVENAWNSNGSTVKNRGPPPGMASGKQKGSWEEDQRPWSFCLIIRNLSQQIEMNTLRTLCSQHGPLEEFQMNSRAGTALIKYKSKEEVIKAQTALNNCVLGNCAIQVMFANESDVRQFFYSQQQQSHQNRAPQQQAQNATSPWNTQPAGLMGSVNNGGAVYRNGRNSAMSGVQQPPQQSSNNGWPAGNMWSFGAGNGGAMQQSGNALWAAAGGNNERNTPSSSLQNLLPGDLLSGEST